MTVPAAGRKRETCAYWVEVTVTSPLIPRPRAVKLCDLYDSTRPPCETCARYGCKEGSTMPADLKEEGTLTFNPDGPPTPGGNGTRAHDAVNHPSHYCLGGIEVIAAIEAWELGFHEGNVVKYVARAKHKGHELQDLEKASFYLNRLVRLMGGKPGGLTD